MWYLAESAAHAVAEIIQGLRNQRLDAADLVRANYPLALVEVTLDAPEIPILDLCDPDVLSRHGIRPDVLANWDFAHTQRVARQLFATGAFGFRWWSALAGNWHSTILFHSALKNTTLRFGAPEPLTLDSDAVRKAARRLSISLDVPAPASSKAQASRTPTSRHKS